MFTSALTFSPAAPMPLTGTPSGSPAVSAPPASPAAPTLGDAFVSGVEKGADLDAALAGGGIGFVGGALLSMVAVDSAARLAGVATLTGPAAGVALIGALALMATGTIAGGVAMSSLADKLGAFTGRLAQQAGLSERGGRLAGKAALALVAAAPAAMLLAVPTGTAAVAGTALAAGLMLACGARGALAHGMEKLLGK